MILLFFRLALMWFAILSIYIAFPTPVYVTITFAALVLAIVDYREYRKHWKKSPSSPEGKRCLVNICIQLFAMGVFGYILLMKIIRS